MSGHFEIHKSTDRQFYFHLKASNGEIILRSELYKAKESAQKGIASVQTNCIKDEKFEKKIGKNGQFYFNLKAGNGEIIGNSEMYKTEASRDNGIVSVKANGTTTTIKDKTTE